MESTHRRHDLRCLALHEAAVRVLLEHPEKAARALDVLGRWEAQDPGSHAQPLWDEWRRIIDNQLWDVAIEDTDRGQQLRQASPLPFVLEPEVREEIRRRYTLRAADVDFEPPKACIVTKPPELE